LCPSGFRAVSPTCVQARANKLPGGGHAGIKRAERSGETQEAPCGSLTRETGNFQWRARAYPEWENEMFFPPDLSSCGSRIKCAGCGRVRSRNTYFGHVLIAVCQGRQRRDAGAAGEEQLGRCKAGWLYPPKRFTFGEFGSLADSFAAGAPPPKLV
jgi:hypothetical protein